MRIQRLGAVSLRLLAAPGGPWQLLARSWGLLATPGAPWWLSATPGGSKRKFLGPLSNPPESPKLPKMLKNIAISKRVQSGKRFLADPDGFCLVLRFYGVFWGGLTINYHTKTGGGTLACLFTMMHADPASPGGSWRFQIGSNVMIYYAK